MSCLLHRPWVNRPNNIRKRTTLMARTVWFSSAPVTSFHLVQMFSYGDVWVTRRKLGIREPNTESLRFLYKLYVLRSHKLLADCLSLHNLQLCILIWMESDLTATSLQFVDTERRREDATSSPTLNVLVELLLVFSEVMNNIFYRILHFL
jgi:hypothetical protein